MARPLSYADAVRLLRDPGTRAVDALDTVTSGALLGTAVAVPDVLGWLDARAEFARLSRELVDRLPRRDHGQGRPERTQRLEAAHAVIVLAAFFEVLPNEVNAVVSRARVTKKESVALGTGHGASGLHPNAFIAALLNSPIPAPDPRWGEARRTRALHEYYGPLAARLLTFFQGLEDVWSGVSPDERRRLEVGLRDVPARAIIRYRELFRKLASEFPEVALWVAEGQHAATRAEITDGFGELRDVVQRALEQGDVRESSMSVRAVELLTRVNRRVLDDPLVEERGLPAGLRPPPIGTAYVEPRFRLRAKDDEDVLTRYLEGDEQDRQDFFRFFTGLVVSSTSQTTPSLVLGQPGAGKSLLTRMLAAQLPGEQFLPVRVVLRSVESGADLQTQVEQAVRLTTGERVTWRSLQEARAGRQLVLIFDGLDELIAASGTPHSDFLEQVRSLQEREAALGAPVAAMVTARSSVISLLRVPADSPVIELLPFSHDQVGRWVDTWNASNTGYFEANNIQPLTHQTVLEHSDLATQPLLLLMLALYDLERHEATASGASLSQAELYEGVLSFFIAREVHRRRPGLDPQRVATAVEEEFARLSVAALAMLNRGRQSVTAGELDEDLGALMHEEEPGERLSPGESLIGRFFFVLESEASARGDTLRGYEFLHSTFAEYLVARLIARLVGSRGQANRMKDFAGAARMASIFSFEPLLDDGVLKFLAASLPAPSGDGRELLAEIQARARSGVDDIPGYRPQQVPQVTRVAASTFNLFLVWLHCASRPVGADSMFPGGEGSRAWTRLAGLWKSQLDPMVQRLLRERVRVVRTIEGNRPGLLFSPETGQPVSFVESTALAWWDPADPAVQLPDPDLVVVADSSVGEMLRTAALFPDRDLDVLLDALLPRLAANHHGLDRMWGTGRTDFGRATETSGEPDVADERLPHTGDDGEPGPARPPGHGTPAPPPPATRPLP